MVARGFSLAILGIALAVTSVGTAGEKDKEVKKDVVKDVVKDKKLEPAKDAGKGEKDKKDKKEKKEPPKVELKSVAGEVTIVDVLKGTITVGIEGGKSQTFTVNDDTKFVGPKGGSRGLGKPGMKDETMTKGAAVRVVFAQDEKVALEVHLPARAATPPKTPPETKPLPVKPPDAKPLPVKPETIPLPIKPPDAKPPQTAPPQAAPPEVGPQIIPPPYSADPPVGPVRRLFRRLFR
jgi:hypothetical protein